MNEQFSADAQSIIDSIRKVKAERDALQIRLATLIEACETFSAAHGYNWDVDAEVDPQDWDAFDAAVKAAKDGDA